MIRAHHVQILHVDTWKYAKPLIVPKASIEAAKGSLASSVINESLLFFLVAIQQVLLVERLPSLALFAV